MRIAIITHEFDHRPLYWPITGRRITRARWQIEAFVDVLRKLGHRVVFTNPTRRFRPADLAILHVDATVVPDAYLALAKRYPVCINAAVRSIEKRDVSRDILAPDDDWPGQVLVKSNANRCGLLETRLNATAKKLRCPPPFPRIRYLPEYRHYTSLSEVPDDVWQDAVLVVERFRQELRAGLTVLRVWNFLGSYERASWYLSPERIAKGQNVVAHGPAEVPGFLREERARLGFDYGKFDYAETPEGPVLYDANRTPGFLHARPDLMLAEAPKMAEALLAFVARAQAPS